MGISWHGFCFGLRCRTVMFESTRALWASCEILHDERFLCWIVEFHRKIDSCHVTCE